MFTNSGNLITMQIQKIEQEIQTILSNADALNQTTIRLAEKRYLYEFQEKTLQLQLQVLTNTLTQEQYLQALERERINILHDYGVALSGAQFQEGSQVSELPVGKLQEMLQAFRQQIDDLNMQLSQFQNDSADMSRLQSRVNDTEQTYQELDSFKINDFSHFTMDTQDLYNDNLQTLGQVLARLKKEVLAIKEHPQFLTSLAKLTQTFHLIRQQSREVSLEMARRDYFCVELDRNMSLLSIACYYGDLEGARYMLELSPLSMDKKDSTGLTPLHWAAKGGQDLIVRTLLIQGTNPSAPGEYQRTPLHYAVYNGDSSNYVMSAHYLLQAGADINAEEIDGNVRKSPLHVAIIRGHVNIVKFLVMNPTLKFFKPAQFADGKQIQPLALAIEQGISDVIQSLLKFEFGNKLNKHLAIENALTYQWQLLIPQLSQYIAHKKVNISHLRNGLSNLKILCESFSCLEPPIKAAFEQFYALLLDLLKQINNMSVDNKLSEHANMIEFIVKQLKICACQLNYYPPLEDLNGLKELLHNYADGAWPSLPLPQEKLTELQGRPMNKKQRAQFVAKVLVEISIDQSDAGIKQQIMLTIYSVLKQKIQDPEKLERLKLLKEALSRQDMKWQNSVLKNNLNTQTSYSFWQSTVRYTASAALLFEERFNCSLNSKPTQNLGVLLGSTFSTNKRERLYERESLILDAVYGGFVTDNKNQCNGFVIAVADGAGGHERVDATQYNGNTNLSIEQIRQRVHADNQDFLQRDHQIAKVAHLATKYATYFLSSYPNADICLQKGNQMLSLLKEILFFKNNQECSTLACGRAFALANGFRFIGFNIGDSTLLVWNRKTKSLKTLLPAHVTVVQGSQRATALLPHQYRDFEIHTIDQVLEKECVVIAGTDGLLDVLPCIRTEKEYPNKLRYLEITVDEAKLHPIMQSCADDVSLDGLLAHIARYTVQQVESHRIRLFSEGQSRFQIGDDIALLAIQMPDESPSCNLM